MTGQGTATVQLLEREFHATHRLDTKHRKPHRKSQQQAVLDHYPRTVVRMLAVLVRAETGIALALPVLYGTAVALWRYGLLDPLAFVLAVICVVCSGWGFNALQEYKDFLGTLAPEVRTLSEARLSGVSLMRRGVVAPRFVRDIGLILVCIGLLCALWLGLLEGWPLLFFYGLILLLGGAMIILPSRHAYWGYGVGETLGFLRVGLLPVLIGHYLHAHTLTWMAVWVALPAGLLSVLIYHNYNTIHLRRDWLIHKRTLAVNLGMARALDLSALATVLAFIAILLLVSLSDLPLIALFSLGGLPIALGGFADLRREYLLSRDCVRVYHTTINASTIAALLFSLTLVVDRYL